MPWKLRVKAVEKHINSIFNGKSVVIFSGPPPLQGSKFLRTPLFASAPLTSVCERSLTSVKRFLVKVFHGCSPCFRVWNIYGILVTIIWPNLGFAGVLLTALHKHYGFFLFHFKKKLSGVWTHKADRIGLWAIREWAIMITRNRHVSRPIHVYRHVSHVGVVPGINTWFKA